MKIRKLTAAAVSAFAAIAMSAIPASAYLSVVENPSNYLTSDSGEWGFTITPEDPEYECINGLSKIEVVATVTNMDQYEKDAASGILGDDLDSRFGVFSGHMGLGASISGENVTNTNWQEFGYKGFNDTAGTESQAGIRKLNSNTYLYTADFTGITVNVSGNDTAFFFREWGNYSKDYTLSIDEVFFYAADGSVAIYVDANGNPEFGTHAPLDVSVYESAAPAETTAAETTAATTTVAETTTTVNSNADTTTAAAETEAAATETTTAANKVPGASGSFGSRDSTLLIVGIAAGVVIIGAIVALIIVMGKKKR